MFFGNRAYTYDQYYYSNPRSGNTPVYQKSYTIDIVPKTYNDPTVSLYPYFIDEFNQDNVVWNKSDSYVTHIINILNPNDSYTYQFDIQMTGNVIQIYIVYFT